MQTLYNGLETVYENHAGCERSYFYTKERIPLTLPKKDCHNNILYLPDLIIYDRITNYVVLIEGKML